MTPACPVVFESSLCTVGAHSLQTFQENLDLNAW